jgi:hypothetical protein
MVAISADSSTGIYLNNSAFHGHKSPNNVWPFLPHQMPLSKGQNCQLNGQFAAPSLLAIPAHSCLLPTGPSRGPLVYFQPAASPSPHWALASRPAQLAVSAQPTMRRWRPASLPPPIRKSVNFRNRLLLLLPRTIAIQPRPLPASRHRARGASSSQLEDPFLPPLHRSSYPPSTRALTSFNGHNRHSTSPPLLRPFNRPSPPPEPLSQPL